MKENGVSEQSYYHWQRKFIQQSYELMKDTNTSVLAVQEKTDVAFVEITNDISDHVLAAALREVSHA